ncbi:right-handed parallel beta-helix repeat-containing protein [Candidatus Micrarchaeota archaeon]|nr:right-handed parallel beta-helix repeat-containing protein [Candidatus Micrarchaeota archaeon]
MEKINYVISILCLFIILLSFGCTSEEGIGAFYVKDAGLVDLNDNSTWDPDGDGIPNVVYSDGKYYINQDVRLARTNYDLCPSGSPESIVINCSDCELDCNNAVLEGCSSGSERSRSSGIAVYYQHNIRITNCEIRGFDYGIYAECPSGVIENCEVYDSKTGIMLWRVNDVTVSNCESHDNQEDGIGSYQSRDVRLEGNTIYSNSRHGVYLFNTGGCDVVNNDIFNNENDCGIGADSVQDIEIDDNNIYNNKFGVCGNFFDSRISNNQIYDNSYDGIALNSGNRYRIINNEIISNRRYAINIGNAIISEVRDNELCDNEGEYDIFLEGDGDISELEDNTCDSGRVYLNGDIRGCDNPCTITCVDEDGDGYGACPNCGRESGCEHDGDDCDDDNPDVYPGADELCDGLDNDCDDEIDEGLPTYTYYADTDGDGYGDPGSPYETCSTTPPDGYVDDNTDCNDTNADIHPDAVEVCDDGVDNDCDGNVDCEDDDCSSDPVCEGTVFPEDGMNIVEDVAFPPGTYVLPHGLNVGGDNVRVECRGTVLIGSESGRSDHIGLNITGRTNVTVNGCTFKRYKTGILLSNTDNSIIANNTVEESDEGIVIEDNSQNNQIYDNRISSDEYDIYLSEDSHNNSGNNICEILEDRDENSVSCGSCITPYDYMVIGSNSNVSVCNGNYENLHIYLRGSNITFSCRPHTIFQNSWIEVDSGSQDIEISGCTLRNMSYINLNTQDSNISDVIIHDNQFYYKSSVTTHRNYYVDNVYIARNNFSSSYMGLVKSQNVLVENNVFHYNISSGVRTARCKNITFRNNRFVGDGRHSVGLEHLEDENLTISNSIFENTTLTIRSNGWNFINNTVRLDDYPGLTYFTFSGRGCTLKDNVIDIKHWGNLDLTVSDSLIEGNTISTFLIIFWFVGSNNTIVNNDFEETGIDLGHWISYLQRDLKIINNTFGGLRLGDATDVLFMNNTFYTLELNNVENSSFINNYQSQGSTLGGMYLYVVNNCTFINMTLGNNAKYGLKIGGYSTDNWFINLRSCNNSVNMTSYDADIVDMVGGNHFVHSVYDTSYTPFPNDREYFDKVGSCGNVRPACITLQNSMIITGDVTLCPGTYEVNGDVFMRVVTDGVNVRCNGTVIRYVGDGDGIAVLVSEDADNVNISGCTFEGFKEGVHWYGDNGVFMNNLLNTTRDGMIILGRRNISIKNNTFIVNGRASTVLNLSHVSNVSVEGNQVSGQNLNTGIYLSDSSEVFVNSNNLSLYSGRPTGMSIINSSHVRIKLNNLNTTRNGITVINSSHVQIGLNNISGRSYSIILENISAVNITDNYLSNAGRAIYIKPRITNLAIRNNRFENIRHYYISLSLRDNLFGDSGWNKDQCYEIHAENNTEASTGYPIIFYTGSGTLEDKDVSQLILCGADDSVMSNIRFNAGPPPRVFEAYYTDNAVLREFNASHLWDFIIAKSTGVVLQDSYINGVLFFVNDTDCLVENNFLTPAYKILESAGKNNVYKDNTINVSNGGFVISFTEGAEILNNRIFGRWESSAPYAYRRGRNTGIYLGFYGGHDKLKIINNTMSNLTYAIYFDDSKVSNSIIANNTVTHSYHGVHISLNPGWGAELHNITFSNNKFIGNLGGVIFDVFSGVDTSNVEFINTVSCNLKSDISFSFYGRNMEDKTPTDYVTFYDTIYDLASPDNDTYYDKTESCYEYMGCHLPKMDEVYNDTLFCPGDYPVGDIKVLDNTTIICNGTVFHPFDPEQFNAALNLTGDNITVSGCTFKGYHTAVVHETTPSQEASLHRHLKDGMLTNNTFLDNNISVRLWRVDNDKILDNMLVNTTVGVYVHECENLRVDNNNITVGETGIFGSANEGFVITGNVINNMLKGIHVWSGEATVENNTITDNREYGIRVEHGGVNITGNIVCNNIIADIYDCRSNLCSDNYCDCSGAGCPPCEHRCSETPGGGGVSCVVPVDGMIVYHDTVLCSGEYRLPRGIRIEGHNITLTCNGTVLVGNGPGDGNSGIIVSYGRENKVVGCEVVNYTNGIFVAHSPDTNITECTVRETDKGIIIRDSLSNEVEGCNVTSSGTGVYIENSDHVIVRESRITDTLNNDPIYVRYSDDVSILDNVIENFGGYRFGIDGYRSQRLNISNNIINGGSDTGSRIGILLTSGSDHATVFNNTVNNVFYGVTVYTSYNNLSNNDLCGAVHGFSVRGGHNYGEDNRCDQSVSYPDRDVDIVCLPCD